MRAPLLPILALCLLFAVGGSALADDDAGPTITVEFENAPVRDVITTIAKFAEANVIIPADIDGTLANVSLHEVPWRAALDQVAKLVGCEVVEEAYGILRIVRPTVEAEVVRVYDVRDLVPEKREPAKHAPDSDYLPVVVSPSVMEGGLLTFDEDRKVLVLRATPTVQKAFEKQLAALRRKAKPGEEADADTVTDEDGRFHFEGIRVGFTDAKAQFVEFEEIEARREAAMQAKLQAQLAVLRAELHALRTELAEIKAILLREER
jgi:hypothetical protein